MADNDIDQRVELTCSIDSGQEDQKVITVKLQNNLDETIHIFDSPRMPYYILQDDGSLVILFGVNEPDPDKDYAMIEIPLTRPIEPGASASWEVSLDSIYLKDHYESDREPADLQSPIEVVIQVGWGTSPIEPKDRFRTNINMLLAWQKLTECVFEEVILN